MPGDGKRGVLAAGLCGHVFHFAPQPNKSAAALQRRFSRFAGTVSDTANAYTVTGTMVGNFVGPNVEGYGASVTGDLFEGAVDVGGFDGIVIGER